MNCWCGEAAGQALTRPCYEVTHEGITQPSGRDLALVQCVSCGTIRQESFSYATVEEQEAFYKNYPPTQDCYAVKGYEHDRGVASLRCDDYGIRSGEKIFDVGSGSGAFVDEARARRAEAVGCEIAVYANAKSQDFIYQKRLESVLMPTDSQDRVTCHDVLEHAFDPMAMVREMFRATKQGGACIVEIPRSHIAAGKHHWKQEHLWYWTDQQLSEMLGRAGFQVVAVTHPIESKTRVYATKPPQIRPQILLPPGIGDSYWSMTKLEAFLKAKKLGLPDLQIVCDKDLRHNGHERAFPFLEMFPFAHASWRTHNSGRSPESRALWKEAYAEQGRTIFEDVLDCDYFLSYNGWLRVGAEMDDCDPDLKTDWYSPLHVSLEQERFKRECRELYGPYIAFYFIFQGTYQHWTRDFPLSQVADYINTICAQRKARPLFLGAAWDAEEDNLRWVMQRVHNPVNLLGKTSVEQAFGVMRGAECVVGYPSGLTIMSAVLGAKTLIVWSNYYNKDFFWRCCPPATRGTNYHIMYTQGLSAAALARATTQLIEGKKQTVEVTKVSMDPQAYRRNIGVPVAKRHSPPPPASATPAHTLEAPAYSREVEGFDSIKYSILMPYFECPVEIHKTLRQFASLYPNRRDFEVLIVEDVKKGVPDQQLYSNLKSVEWPFPIRVVRYVHISNFNHSVLFNLGAEHARGRFLLLQKPESFHKVDILVGLDSEFGQDVGSYVACGVESVDARFAHQGWIQHSIQAAKLLQYCTALSKELFMAVGGFDAKFAEGHCFEDDDFRDTVLAYGARVVQRDDLVAQFQRRPRVHAPRLLQLHVRNENLYRQKWNKRVA